MVGRRISQEGADDWETRVVQGTYRHVDGGFPKLGYRSGDPHNKDWSRLGSILGLPYFGKLPSKI